MLRFELITQLLRVRTLIALACLAGVPIAAAAVPFASQPGRRNGNESGLFGASPYSAANHAMASLEFMGPLLLPIVVALLACAIASADRDWGVLRYLYVAPVTRERLLAAKLTAAALATLVAVVVVMAAGLAAGTVLFGWHPFHIIGAATLTTGDAAGRVLAATGYTLLCMLAMAAIAFTLGLLLPRGAEALAVAVGFVVLASVINGQPALAAVAAVLPVHHWQDWVGLFDPAGVSHLALGAVVQLVTIALCASAGWLILRHRDPAA
ncbi:ABC transporter permease subunit [Micromonospora mirobrigensis]|uniref:ABC-2 type transport system permease protein n=1 Tax=Micromonospora mirobrigensis TaxID=262898 RepID=A0A1C4W688_9ACTN|nr:ABC transporter permease subunit [Micromonospora mirobrigensis]SCE91746.1 ABC-2 type transport system permease protein [Micromonospora mirobrigensis]